MRWAARQVEVTGEQAGKRKNEKKSGGFRDFSKTCGQPDEDSPEVPGRLRDGLKTSAVGGLNLIHERRH
jgi:hypothetical protein